MKWGGTNCAAQFPVGRPSEGLHEFSRTVRSMKGGPPF